MAAAIASRSSRPYRSQALTKVLKSRLFQLANPSSRMISLSKSKEYARLAANVPGVYSVEEGKKALHESEMQPAGVVGVG